ncbi:MAG TPA: universal stress protein [Nitrososphaeraceae archaeon]|jgi:nucleotide-binding universal stress UspA family protein
MNGRIEKTLVITKFSKILVAVDGSESSMDAADFAISIAKKECNASLIALHVIQSTYWNNPLGLVTPTSIEGSLERYKQKFQPWFDKIKEEADYNKIQLKTDIIISPISIVGAIINYSEEEKANLIVIGTRGRSGFKKILLGSVAAGVVRYAHCPVMVLK